jgi:DNA processing protein
VLYLLTKMLRNPQPRPPRPPTSTHWVAFNRIPGIGAVRIQALLGRFGTLAEAWLASRSELKEAGLDDRTVRVIAEKRAEIEPEREMERLAAADVRVLTWNDAGYPAQLKEIDDSPPVLYIRGELSPQDAPVRRCRHPPAHAIRTAGRRRDAYAIAANGVPSSVASPRGVDGIATAPHLEARRQSPFSPAPRHGLPASTQARPRSWNAALTSGALGAQPRGDFFRGAPHPLRPQPRVLVIEGDMKSGASNHRRLRERPGRDVFCLARSIFSRKAGHQPQDPARRGQARPEVDDLGELNLAVPNSSKCRS